MICPNCRTANESYALKCQYCGAPLRDSYDATMLVSKDVILDKDSLVLQAESVQASSPQKRIEKKRSKGVTVLGWLHIVWGFLSLILITITIRMLFSPNTLRVIRSRFENRFPPLSFNPWFFILITIIGVFSTLSLIIGRGLLDLKEWSRKSAIYLSTFGIIYNLIYLARCFSRDLRASSWIGNSIISIIIIYFFTRQKVKEQFK